MGTSAGRRRAPHTPEKVVEMAGRCRQPTDASIAFAVDETDDVVHDARVGIDEARRDQVGLRRVLRRAVVIDPETGRVHDGKPKSHQVHIREWAGSRSARI